jgi:hypothetical protein
MLSFADPIVDTSALWKIILASLAGGAGVAIAFGILLIGLSRAAKTERAARFGSSITGWSWSRDSSAWPPWCWAFTR